jgi:DNA-3-methyladenine glycosylase
MHYCLNVSCEPDGRAGCVLVRALEPIAGLAAMAELRGLRGLPPNAPAKMLTSGPGKLCQALAITRPKHNGIDLTDPESPLQIADDGFPPTEISASPRIGISKASALELRFFVPGNRFVSGRRKEILRAP